MRKKLISFALAAAMLILCALPAAAAAEGAGFKGRGTAGDPFEISTADELTLLSEMTASGISFEGRYFKLTADIDMKGRAFTPIGPDALRPFAGSFDGAGHTVSGLEIELEGDNAGLFGHSTGAISGVAVADSFISGRDLVGGIVGFGSAENCISSAEVSGRSRVGGISGEGEAYNCESRCEVWGKTEVGGLVGRGQAFDSVSRGSVSGERRVSGTVGLGTGLNCKSFASVRAQEPEDPETRKYSVASFVRWALKHIDPSTIPTNAVMFLANSSCGSEPWEYLYGSVRVTTSQSTINSFYNNNYTKTLTRAQYDDVTADWSRSTYATDCQGLLDAWLTYVQGETTDINVQMNYDNWCTSKGEISSITRDWVVGEAVFVWSKKMQRFSHIGWICGFDEDGEPLVVEARGLAFGVVVTRLKDRSWTHRGLMTVKFNYDAYMKGAFVGIPAEDTPQAVKEEAPAMRDIWDGTVASGFAGGSGTAEDPYLVANGKQLAYLASAVSYGNTFSGKYIAMTDDIWLNDTTGWEDWDFLNPAPNVWNPIGCYTNNNDKHPFKGSFDGGGHTVYGVFLSYNKESFYGLFGYVGENQNGRIKNLTVSRSFIEAVHNVGGIVGYMENYGGIESCVFSGKSYGDYFVGGIVGYAANASGSTTIINCYNLGRVRGALDIGGIAGYLHENSSVAYCSGMNYVRGYENGGGIVGYMNASFVTACRNDGTSRGVETNGGIVGYAVNSAINKCYNGHDVISVYRAGGIAGSISGGSLSNCFSTGGVSTVEYAGGLVGKSYGASVSTSYNVGSLTSRRYRGGAAAYMDGSSSVSNIYILEGCCTNGTAYGVPLPAAAFVNESSYEGFDFETVWTIDTSTQYPFAELRSAPYTAAIIPEFEAPAWVLGDVDGDGTVAGNDALLLLRYALGLQSLNDDQLLRGDVNGDGVDDANDALVVLRVSLGLMALE